MRVRIPTEAPTSTLLAQPGERLPYKQEVKGSIPLPGTNIAGRTGFQTGPISPPVRVRLSALHPGMRWKCGCAFCIFCVPSFAKKDTEEVLPGSNTFSIPKTTILGTEKVFSQKRACFNSISPQNGPPFAENAPTTCGSWCNDSTAVCGTAGSGLIPGVPPRCLIGVMAAPQSSKLSVRVRTPYETPICRRNPLRRRDGL